MNRPIPVFGVPSCVKPRRHMYIDLYWNTQDGINWDRGEKVSKAQLEVAIKQSAGRRLPNDMLPALDPGDVVVLKEGIFWITRDWQIIPLAFRTGHDN